MRRHTKRNAGLRISLHLLKEVLEIPVTKDDRVQLSYAIAQDEVHYATLLLLVEIFQISLNKIEHNALVVS